MVFLYRKPQKDYFFSFSPLSFFVYLKLENISCLRDRTAVSESETAEPSTELNSSNERGSLAVNWLKDVESQKRLL